MHCSVRRLTTILLPVRSPSAKAAMASARDLESAAIDGGAQATVGAVQ